MEQYIVGNNIFIAYLLKHISKHCRAFHLSLSHNIIKMMAAFLSWQLDGCAAIA